MQQRKPTLHQSHNGKQPEELVCDEILGIDVNNLTPLEALNKLNEIKKIVRGK